MSEHRNQRRGRRMADLAHERTIELMLELSRARGPDPHGLLPLREPDPGRERHVARLVAQPDRWVDRPRVIYVRQDTGELREVWGAIPLGYMHSAAKKHAESREGRNWKPRYCEVCRLPYEGTLRLVIRGTKRPFCEACATSCDTLGLKLEAVVRELDLRRVLRKYYPEETDLHRLVDRLPY
ncbi:MAG: hypothetical protein QOF76_3452 [Solirubrobacteraceae bacterium]|jgi:hypothetical protein|nr:hypothetical protein [Solirubrobacteraceae bacterium]